MENKITVTCSCGKVLIAPADKAGKVGKCPGCGKDLLIAPVQQVAYRRRWGFFWPGISCFSLLVCVVFGILIVQMQQSINRLNADLDKQKVLATQTNDPAPTNPQDLTDSEKIKKDLAACEKSIQEIKDNADQYATKEDLAALQPPAPIIEESAPETVAPDTPKQDESPGLVFKEEIPAKVVLSEEEEAAEKVYYATLSTEQRKWYDAFNHPESVYNFRGMNFFVLTQEQRQIIFGSLRLCVLWHSDFEGIRDAVENITQVSVEDGELAEVLCMTADNFREFTGALRWLASLKDADLQKDWGNMIGGNKEFARTVNTSPYIKRYYEYRVGGGKIPDKVRPKKIDPKT